MATMSRPSPLQALVLLCSFAIVPLPIVSADPSQLAAAEIAFTQGLLALEERHDSDALDRFSEATRLDPDNGSPRYWLGLALLRLGRSQEAVQAIEASLKARRPPQVERDRVLSDLATAHRVPEGTAVTLELPKWRPDRVLFDHRGNWEGNLSLAVVEDSNPSLLSEELSLPIPEGTQGDLVRGEESDGAVSASLRFGWYPPRAWGGWSLGTSLELGQSLYQSLDFLDLGRGGIVVQLARGEDPTGYLTGPLGSTRVPFGNRRSSVLLQGGTLFFWLNSSSYLRIWEGAVSLSLRETRATSTQLGIAFADRDFAAGGLANERRSGQDLWLRLNQSFLFGRRERFLRIGVTVGDRRAGRAFASSVLEGSAAAAIPVSLRWTVSAEAAVREDDFEHPESNLFAPTGRPRRDTTTRVSLELAWAVTERLRWKVRGTSTNRDSTVDLGRGLPDLGYERRTFSVGGNWSF